MRKSIVAFTVPFIKVVLITVVFITVSAAGLAAVPAHAATDQQPPAPAAPPPAACVDFYAHSNADWLAGEPAAPNLFAELEALSLERQRALLDALAAAPADAVDRQLGAFWRAASDEAALEAAGTSALKPWLQRIDDVKKTADLADLLADAHAAGLPLLFRFDVGADLREPGRTVVYARQGGLGLPDRDYYLREDPATEALRTHYRAYVGRLLALVGTPAERVGADVAAVMDIESRLARASLSLVQLRDPNNSWLPAQLDDIEDRYEHLDWKGFLRTQGLRKLRGLSLAHTSFFVEADHLAGALPIGQWRAYLRFHVAHELAPHLTRAFRDAHFTLFGMQLEGLKAPPPRWQAALQATDAALGEWLGQRYATRYLDQAAAARARTLAEALVAALKQRLLAAEWLGAPARAAGAAKLDALQIVIGHDDPPPQGKLADLSPDDHAANMLAAAAWRQQAAFAGLGDKPRPAPLRGHRVSAFHDAGANRLLVSAAFLSPPLFDPAMDAARLHGGLGTLLGHEISHAVDLYGSTFAADGSTAPWWSTEDYQRFTQRSSGLTTQYSGYRALSDVTIDGKRTFLENAADLAGLELAWDAFGSAVVGADADAGTETAASGGDPQQRFFHAFARTWRQRADPAALRMALATDVHAPPRWRVQGTLANFRPFAETFGCAAPPTFVLPDAQRVRIWH